VAMMENFLRKWNTGVEVRKAYRNWPLWFLNRWGLRWPASSVQISIGGAKLVGPNNSETWGTVDQIWRQKVYTQYFPILDGYRVLDIGAHFGFFSAFAAFQGKDVRVVSYEPSSRNFNILENNISINQKQSQVQAFNFALSDADGKSPLYKPKDHDDSATLFAKNLSHTDAQVFSEVVNVKQANAVWKLYDRYDFVKLDCEGAEYLILCSLQDDVRRFRHIAIEYHGDPGPIKELLNSKGFTVLSLVSYSVSPWCAFSEMGMLYATNNEY